MDFIDTFIHDFNNIWFSEKERICFGHNMVGQPLMKLMLKPFCGEKLFLILYIGIGFYCLSVFALAKRKGIKLGRLTKRHLDLYLLFCFFIIISLIYTPNTNYGMKKFIDFFSVSFLIISISIITISDEEDLINTMKAIANVSLIIGIITVVLVYIKTGGIIVRVGSTLAKDIEIFGTNFAVSIWFGRRMGIAFWSMLFAMLLDNNMVNYIKTALLFILVILSNSRGPILSMLITFFIVIVLNLNRTNYRRLFAMGTIILLSIMIAMIAMFNTRLGSFNDSNVSHRLLMYLFCIKMIKENLLGFGVGSFDYLYGLHRYPHNIILEIIFELGIQSLTIFVLCIFITIKRYLSYLKKCTSPYSTYLNYSFAVLLYAFVNAQFSGDIVSNEYVWFGFILMGICMRITDGYMYENNLRECITKHNSLESH